MDKRASIVILDDHPLVAEGLRSVCLRSGRVEEVVLFTETVPFIAYLQQHDPGMLLIDLKLKDGADGRDIIREIRRDRPDTKIIVLSAFDDPGLIRSSYASGADAYLVKNVSFDEVLACIEAIRAGQAYMHPDVLRILTADEDKARRQPQFEKPRLTRQERNVLKLIVREKTTREIATELRISENTVESHRKNLIMKMDVRNIAGLVRKAMEWNLLKEDGQT